ADRTEVRPLVVPVREDQRRALAVVAGHRQPGIASVLVHSGTRVPRLRERVDDAPVGPAADYRSPPVLPWSGLTPPDLVADGRDEPERYTGAGQIGGADGRRPFAVRHLPHVSPS